MSEQYTAYPGEDEVVIQDGLQYRVIEIQKVENEENIL